MEQERKVLSRRDIANHLRQKAGTHKKELYIICGVILVFAVGFFVSSQWVLGILFTAGDIFLFVQGRKHNVTALNDVKEDQIFPQYPMKFRDGIMRNMVSACSMASMLLSNRYSMSCWKAHI